MPEAEEKKLEPMVDIDTSGPEVEVNVEENKKEEPKVEEPKEEIKVEEVKEEPKVEEPKEEKKKELEDYSEGVQKRIAKLTKKWREAERQKEAAIEYSKGVQKEQESLKTKLSTIEPNYMTAMEGRVVSGLQAAQSQLVKAREAGDVAAEVEAQKMIARLGVEEARVANLKKQAAAKPAETQTQTLDQAMAPKQPTPDPKAEAWAEKNPWFGEHDEMTALAMGLDKKLKQEGFDPRSDEYYTEINKRIRKRFPEEFEEEKTSSANRVAPADSTASRSSNKGRRTVKLSPSQVAMAKRLNVPLEEYAKYVKE